MKYSYKCPAPGCSFVTRTTADTDEVAIDQLLIQGQEHVHLAHPDMPQMTPEQMRSMVEVGMQKSG